MHQAWILAYVLHFFMKATINPARQFNADFWAWYIDPVTQVLVKGMVVAALVSSQDVS